MNLHYYPGPCSNLCAETRLIGTHLREIRRSRGLTQRQLADLLGVSQPNISRWEAGIEVASPRCNSRMEDIFFNRSGDLDRLVEMFFSTDPDVVIFSTEGDNWKFLHLGEHICRVHPFSPELIGQDYVRLFNTDYRNKLYGNLDVNEFVYVAHHHDLHFRQSRQGQALPRIHTNAFSLHVDGDVRLMINRPVFSRQTGEPPVAIKRLFLSDLAST